MSKRSLSKRLALKRHTNQGVQTSASEFSMRSRMNMVHGLNAVRSKAMEIARRRVDNTKQVVYTEDDGVQPYAIYYNEIVTKNWSVGSLASYPTREMVKAEGNTPWVVNGLNLFNFFPYTMAGSAGVPRVVRCELNDASKANHLVSPFAVYDEESGEIYLNSMQKLNDAGTYIRGVVGEDGITYLGKKSGGKYYNSMKIYKSYSDNLAEIKGLQSSVSGTPTVNSGFNLPYEGFVMILMASGFLKVGSGEFTSESRNVATAILAQMNTFIFEKLHLKASGMELTELEIDLQTWWVLGCNFFNKCVIPDDGYVNVINVTNPNASETKYESYSTFRIVSDTLRMGTKDVMVYVPMTVKERKYAYRGIVNYPLQVAIPKSRITGEFGPFSIIQDASGFKIMIRTTGEEIEVGGINYYLVNAKFDGLFFPPDAKCGSLIRMADIAPDTSGITIKLDGIVATQSTSVDKAASAEDVTVSIGSRAVASANTTLLVGYKADYSLYYAENSSWEVWQKMILQTNYTPATVMGAKIPSDVLNTCRSNSIVQAAKGYEKVSGSGFVFDWEDFGATRALGFSGKWQRDTNTKDNILYIPLSIKFERTIDLSTSSVGFTMYSRANAEKLINEGDNSIGIAVYRNGSWLKSDLRLTASGSLPANVEIDDSNTVYYKKVGVNINLSSLYTSAGTKINVQVGDFIALYIKPAGCTSDTYEIYDLWSSIVYTLDATAIQYDAQDIDTAHKQEISDSYDPKNGCYRGDKWEFVTMRMLLNPSFDLNASEDEVKYLEKLEKNLYLSCINGTTIRLAFAKLRKVPINDLFDLLAMMTEDIDPLIYDKLSSAVKGCRTSRLTQSISEILDALTDTTDDDVATFSTRSVTTTLADQIRDKLIQVDERYHIDFPDAGAEWNDELNSWVVPFEKYFGQTNISSMGITPEYLGYSVYSDEYAAVSEFLSSNPGFDLAGIIAIASEGDATDLGTQVCASIISKSLNEARTELNTLQADILADYLESSVDQLLDDDGMYTESDESNVSAQIDAYISAIAGSLNAGIDNEVDQLTGAGSRLNDFIEDGASFVQDRFHQLAASVKSNAIAYYRDAKKKITEQSENLNNLLSFKVTNLLNSVLQYGDDLGSYLKSMVSNPGMSNSSYGWQDTTLFTPASNIALVTGAVGSGVTGALSTALSLVKKVASGLGNMVRGAITTAVLDGVSFKKKLSGYETLSIQSSSKVYTPEYFEECYTWLYEKISAILDGNNSYYLVSQVDNLYLFFQDAPNGSVMVTANPKLELKDDTLTEVDTSNDWNVAKRMAQSIIKCIEKQNAILAKCADIGIITYQPAYEVPEEQKLYEHILSRAQAKSAEGVIAAKSIIWGIGIALGAILCCTGVGSVAGVALIAGACAVGSAMCGEPETLSKVERLEEDSTYANGLITSADLINIWVDALPGSMIDLELSMLDYLSNCTLDIDNSKPYDFVSDGSADAVDFTTSEKYQDFTGLGFLPLVTMAGAPKFKYSLVTDSERAVKSAAILAVVGTTVAIAAGKAVKATLSKVKKKKLAKLQAQAWSMENPSKDQYTRTEVGEDGEEITVFDDEAYKAARNEYQDKQARLAYKTNRLDAIISRSTSSGSSGNLGSTMTKVTQAAVTVASAEDLSIEGLIAANKATSSAEAANASIGSVHSIVADDAAETGAFKALKSSDETIGNTTQEIKDAIFSGETGGNILTELMSSVLNDDGKGDLILGALIGAIAIGAGVTTAEAGTLLVNAIKNSASGINTGDNTPDDF